MKKYELKLDSPAFEALRKDLDNSIAGVLRQLHDGNFASGDISVKINLELVDSSEEFAVGFDDDGNPTSKKYEYKKPSFEHQVTIMLKKREITKGTYHPNAMEIKQMGEEFVVSEVTKAQLSLDEWGL